MNVRYRRLSDVMIALLVLLLWAPPAFGQDGGDDLNPEQRQPERKKLAQSGMKFLSFSVNARAVAIANAVTAEQYGSSLSLFYNPASMATLGNTFDVGLGTAQWFADINYNSGTAAFRPGAGNLGVFGVSVMAVDYGEVFETIRADNEKGYERIGTLTPSAYVVGLGYARTLSDRVSIGGHLKYAHESLGSNIMRTDSGGNYVRSDNKVGTVAFDFGVIYNTGYRSLVLGFSAHNIAPELRYFEEGFETPMAISMGASMNMMDFFSPNQDLHDLQLFVNANRPRDYDEHLSIGSEYIFMNVLALRAGYSIPGRQDEGVSLGAGLQPNFGGLDVSIDYAYTSFEFLDDVHRFSVNVGF